MAGNRGPTPTDTDDRTTLPAEGGYEVVTADGERKPASLPQRIKDGIRDTLSMTDDLPTWQPGELADDSPTLPVPAIANGDPGQAEQEQPPPKVLRELRRRHAAEVEQRVGMASVKVAGLIELDRWMRRYAINLQHLGNLAVLVGEGRDLLQERRLPPPELRARFRAELDEWDRDLEAGDR